MNSKFALIAAVAGLMAMPSFSFAAEKEIAMTDAPAAVQAAVKKSVGDHKVDSFSKESEDGKTTFEAEFKIDGVDHSVTIAEDGNVIEEEASVKPDALPTAVKEAATKSEPTGKIKDASKVMADGKSYFELDVMVGDVKHELKIEVSGKVISNDVEKEES